MDSILKGTPPLNHAMRPGLATRRRPRRRGCLNHRGGVTVTSPLNHATRPGLAAGLRRGLRRHHHHVDVEME